MKEEIRDAILTFIRNGNHTPEEIKAEISRLLHGEIFPGEIDSVYEELMQSIN